MLKDFKKKRISGALYVAIGLIFVFALMCLMRLNHVKYLVTPALDFSEMTTKDIESSVGKKVTMKIDLNYGTFSELYIRRPDGLKHVEEYAYVILNYDQDDPRYMAVRLPNKYANQMDAIEANTYAGKNDKTLTYTGQIFEMSNNEKKYFWEFFEEAEFTKSDFEEQTLTYIVHTPEDLDESMFLLAFAGIFLVAGLIVMIIPMLGVGFGKVKKQIKKLGYDYNTMENDYANAGFSLKDNSLKIGKIACYCIGTPDIFLNKDIVWAYQMTTSHTTNGLDSGKTYEIYFWDVNGKRHSASMSESAVKSGLEFVNTHMPWVITGYSEELKHEYNKNRQGFLDMLYNKVPHEYV